MSKVFISYAHAQDNFTIVRELKDALESAGIKVTLDIKAPPPGSDWGQWMDKSMAEADWVLMLFDQAYREAYDGMVRPGERLGVSWEIRYIRGELYNNHTRNKRFILLLKEDTKLDLLPNIFALDQKYYLPKQVQLLIEWLKTHGKIKCGHCGEVLGWKLVHCPYCGKPLEQSASLPNSLDNTPDSSEIKLATTTSIHPTYKFLTELPIDPNCGSTSGLTLPNQGSSEAIAPPPNLVEPSPPYDPIPTQIPDKPILRDEIKEPKLPPKTDSSELDYWLNKIFPALILGVLVAAGLLIYLMISQKPTMALIPEGDFKIGSETGGNADERQPSDPIHIKAFEIGQHEVTYVEYDRFAEEKGLQGHQGKGKEPVRHIRWVDAYAYSEWLCEQTGTHYRLPTEAEWEYTARLTRNPGNKIPVYEMIGKGYEMTGSAYAENYNGSEQLVADPNEDTRDRAVRGGETNYERLTTRYRISISTPHSEVGFRLARDNEDCPLTVANRKP